MRVVEALKWKSFTLVADGDNEDDVQNIAKKVTSNAITKGLCVMVHDNEEEDLTSQIVHIGKPVDDFFRTTANSTILVASEGNLENYLNRINSSNTIILLEDARYSIHKHAHTLSIPRTAFKIPLSDITSIFIMHDFS